MPSGARIWRWKGSRRAAAILVALPLLGIAAAAAAEPALLIFDEITPSFIAVETPLASTSSSPLTLPGEHATALVYRENYPGLDFAGVSKTIVLTEDDAEFSSPSMAGDAGVLIEITDRAGGFFDLALVPEQLLDVEVGRYADSSCDGSTREVGGELQSLETAELLRGLSYSCEAGGFEVLEIDFGPAGELVALAADFAYRGSGGAWSVSGSLRYRASPEHHIGGILELAPIEALDTDSADALGFASVEQSFPALVISGRRDISAPGLITLSSSSVGEAELLGFTQEIGVLVRLSTFQSADQVQYGAGSIWSQIEARGLDELAAARKARVEALRNRDDETHAEALVAPKGSQGDADDPTGSDLGSGPKQPPSTPADPASESRTVLGLTIETRYFRPELPPLLEPGDWPGPAERDVALRDIGEAPREPRFAEGAQPGPADPAAAPRAVRVGAAGKPRGAPAS